MKAFQTLIRVEDATLIELKNSLGSLIAACSNIEKELNYLELKRLDIAVQKREYLNSGNTLSLDHQLYFNSTLAGLSSKTDLLDVEFNALVNDMGIVQGKIQKSTISKKSANKILGKRKCEAFKEIQRKSYIELDEHALQSKWAVT